MTSRARLLNLAAAAAIVGTSCGALAFSPFGGAALVRTAAVPNCTSSQLHVTHGPVMAGFIAEGRKITTTLIFTNTGATCAIWGVPSVRAATGKNHAAVGPWAANQSSGAKVVHHVLKGHAAVSSKYSAAVYYSLATCHQQSADGVVVVLPKFALPVYLSLAMSVCTGVNSETTQLIQPGTAG